MNQTKHYFPRRCDVTGEGMNEGFVIGDGEMYIKHESDLVAHLRTLDWGFADGRNSRDIESDDELRELLYADDYFYFTDWDDEEMEYVSDYADGRDAVEIASANSYEVIFSRTYTTRVTIEASNRDEAEAKFNEMVSDGIIYQMELEQMEVDNEEVIINEKGGEA